MIPSMGCSASSLHPLVATRASRDRSSTSRPSTLIRPLSEVRRGLDTIARLTSYAACGIGSLHRSAMPGSFSAHTPSCRSGAESKPFGGVVNGSRCGTGNGRERADEAVAGHRSPPVPALRAVLPHGKTAAGTDRIGPPSSPVSTSENPSTARQESATRTVLEQAEGLSAG